MKGKEELDTVEKLKDFWLFAIAQGWESYEMREWVAGLTKEATWKSSLLPFITHLPYEDPLHIAYLEFCTWEYIGKAPKKPTYDSDEEYADTVWASASASIEDIVPGQYNLWSIRKEQIKDMLRSWIHARLRAWLAPKRKD